MGELRALVPYLRPYGRGYAAGLFLVAFSNVFTVAIPHLLKTAIDDLSNPGLAASRIWSYTAAIVLLTLVGGATKFGMRQILNSLSRRVECDLRMAFFRKLLHLDAAFHGRSRTGEIMSLATNDTLAVRMAAGPAIMYAVNTVVIFLFCLILMFRISPSLTGMALLPMLALPPLVFGFGAAIQRRFETIQEQYGSISTFVQENLTGVRIVRAYRREAEQAAGFSRMNEEYLRKNMRLAHIQGTFHPSLTLLTTAAVVFVLWFGGQAAMEGRISIGEFVAFGFYLNLLGWPMISLGWVIGLFRRGEASMIRLNRVLLAEPQVQAPDSPVRPERWRGDLSFRGVSFRYPGSDRWVLRDIDLEIPHGTTVAVVGATGSGKSTLVQLIPRLHDPTEGEIRIDGIPLPRLEPEELRRRIGVVPQDPFLFSETIEENIGVGIVDDAPPLPKTGIGDGSMEGRSDEGGIEAVDHWERIEAAARMAQLHESISEFPSGYRTRLGERGINLSGGQKQRATLARALARDPAILVLDDALSAVDTQTEARILEDLRPALRDRTTFIISHRVTAVMHADLIVVLEDGRIAEKGTHDELIRAGGRYARLLRRQMLEREIEG